MSDPRVNEIFRLIHILETLIFEDEMQNPLSFCV